MQNSVLLLGGNGVGKTSVPDAMFALRKVVAGEVKIDDRAAFHPSTLTRWQAGRNQVFEVQAGIGGESFTYRLGIEHDEGGKRSRIVEESLVGNGTTLFRFDLGEVGVFRDDGSEGPVYKADRSESALARVVPQPGNTRLTAFMDTIRDTVVCTIRPAGLRAESTREARLVDRYAGNFVDWYRHAVQENPRLAQAHVEALRPSVDGFHDVHLRQAGLDTRAMLLDFVAHGGGRSRNGGHCRLRLQDGQQTLVVLYALLQLVGIINAGSEGPLEVVIRSRKARPVCDACGGGVWSKGYRSVVLVDLPAFGRPVRLCWRKRRWTCRERRRVVPITTGGVARRDPLGCVGHVGPVSNGPMTGCCRTLCR